MLAIFQDRPVKRLKRWLLNNEVSQSVIAALLAGYIWLVYATSDVEHDFHDDAKEYMSGEKQGIYAFWHGRMMLIPFIQPPGRRLQMLISHHRDGLLISRIVSHFGTETIRGSTGKSGTSALKEILRAVKQGQNIGFTPDGPRGPAFEVSEGVIRTARMTGLPIIPLSFSTNNHKRFGSWDAFFFALPFSQLLYIAGKPIRVSRDDSEEVLEQKRYQLQIDLQAITSHVDARAGKAKP